jgi:hypothetical protein
MTNELSGEIDKTSKNIVSIFAFIMLILTATISIITIPLQIVMAQNITSCITDATNLTGINKALPELAIIPNSFIIKIKDPSELGGVSFTDAIEQIVEDLESKGYNLTVTNTFPALITYVIEIEHSLTDPHTGASTEVDPQEYAKTVEQILKQNLLIESAQANMKMTIPKPITNTNASTTPTNILKN